MSEFIRPKITDKEKGIYGHVDFINANGIGGWVIDVQSAEPRVVEVYINDEKVGEYVANLPRQDISQILGRDAKCGFYIRWVDVSLPSGLKWDSGLDIAVVDKLSGREIIGKHAKGRKPKFIGRAEDNKDEKHELTIEDEQIKEEYRIIKESGLFDEEWYLKTYKDVARDGWDPIMHYIKHGWKELRNPSPEFDTAFYLSKNLDVAMAGVNPLVHYIKYGRFEGRIPLPPIPRVSWDLEFPKKNGLKGHIDRVEVKEDSSLVVIGWFFVEGKKIIRVNLILDETFQSIPVIYGIPRLDVFRDFKVKESSKSGFSARIPITREGKYSVKLEIEFDDMSKIIIDLGYITVKQLYKSKWVINDEYNKYPLVNKIDSILPYINSKTFDYKSLNLPEMVDIIIPVFNGYQYITKLFESVLRNTNHPYRLIVIDDASTDYRVVDFLNGLKQRLAEDGYPEFILIRNEKNLGFVASVNRALSLSNNHVVLLNTDTVVSPGWLYRLMKPIFDYPEKVASTTPFTNAGTICSFPNFLEDNDLPQEFDYEKIDKVFSLIDTEKFMIELPSAVGFCMGINKRALKDIGYFNEELFGKGYGEENDWSMRASIKGYKNILVPNLFIYHKHGGSFSSSEKQSLMNKNLEIIKTLYPNYIKLVNDFINDDPPKAVRDFVFFKYIIKHVDTTLIVDHNIGGGANVYSRKLIEDRIREGNVVLHYTENIVNLERVINLYYKKFKKQFVLDDYNLLTHILDDAKLVEIILNNLVSYIEPLKMLDLLIEIKKKKPGISIVFPVHDFYSICPSYNLLDKNGVFCNVPEDISVCINCISENIYAEIDTDISMWRKSWREFLKFTDKIVLFSNSSKDIIKKAYPEISDEKIYILPHKLDVIFRKPRLSKPDKEINIAVIGNINYAKGAKVISDLLKMIERKKLAMNVFIIGNLESFFEKSYGNLKILGSYKREDLPDILEKENIHIVFFPSICPETFSYVVEECIEMGLPIVAFDIGAPAERLRNYKSGRLVRVGDIEGVIEAILNLCKEYKR